MDDQTLLNRIEQIKAELGTRASILVHHYQRDDVIRFADFRGDSLQLSRIAAEQQEAKYILFCGVNFMAETAAMLCSPEQRVLLPAGDAPCPMAQMADIDQVEEAWEMLTSAWGKTSNAVPITYQNSTAEIKAFCGRHGGAVCTSSNAERLFRWALEEYDHVVFFPDEWLGTNSAIALGVPPAKITAWNPGDVEFSIKQATQATAVVWKGYCNVHTYFKISHIQDVRSHYPKCKIIVHPECPTDIVQAADAYGSTAQIIQFVEQAPVESTVVVGTEINMVNRLASQYPDKHVIPLARSLCGAMYRTHPQGLYEALDSCHTDTPIHVVTVDDEIRHWANLALERMLNL